MAFGSKYKITFRDAEDQACYVHFQVDGYTGSVTDIAPGPLPAMLEYHANEKYQTVVGSSLTIQAVYSSTVENLFTDDAQQIRVTFIQGGTTTWRGFVVPGQFYRKFNKSSYIVTLLATDQLGILKEMPFQDGSGDPYFYQQTEMTAISNILQKTGLELTIYDEINIYEDAHTSTIAYSPLLQTYFYPEKYWDEQNDVSASCYEVLTDILKKYGARVYQSNDTWHLQRPNSQWMKHWRRTYTYMGVYSTSTTVTPYIDVDTQDYEWIGLDAEQTRLMPYGKVKIVSDPPRRSNVLKNGSFDSHTWDSGLPRYWTEYGTFGISEDNDTLKVPSSEGGALDDYIYCSMNIWKANGITLSFDLTPTYTGSPTNAYFTLEIIDTSDRLTNAGGSLYWNSGSGYWQYDCSTITSGDTEHVSIDFPDRSEYVSFYNVTQLTIRIHYFVNENSATTNYVNIDNMKLTVGYDDSDVKVYTQDNDNTVYKLFNDSIAIGDSWMHEEYTSAYDDTFFIESTATGRGNLTDSWQIVTDGTSAQNIAQLLARQYVEGYWHALDLIRANFYIGSDDPFYYKSIQDERFTDSLGFTKTFIPLESSYNAARCTLEGSFVEVPVVYVDESMEWSSSTFDSYTITANSIEINNSGGDDYAYFDSYTALSGETIRMVIELTNDGSSDLPRMAIDSTELTVAWGTNAIEFNFSTSGSKTLEIGNGGIEDTYNLTCAVNFYSLKGQ